ncbi:nuclear transport factor 2 family protein [Amycolatopsis anabasis]|uniref:nuclear transport factor 2 family protein n=1 Tax=Amycolatopsis anabasis TaxID=1840409 RepID=UPI00131C1D17|nr:nuclear transport factor 2 family protein [Amycolatopsis anabasis]
MGPRELFDRLSAGIADGRWTELPELYAENTVVEHPQAVGGPSRLDGREAVAARFARLADGSMELRPHDIVVHETTDPELIVAEFDYAGRVRATGRTFETANIMVLRARDGLLVHTRDYHDYLAMAAAREELDGFAAAARQRPADVAPFTARVPSAAAPDSPRGVFERLVYGVSDRRLDEVPELYAEDAYVTHPFHPSAAPLKGRDQLREHFAKRTARSAGVGAGNLVVHETTDPEVIVAEFEYRGETGTGGGFGASNIFVLRVRDGLVAESRDYADHVAFAVAAGTLDDLVAAARDRA